MKKNRSLFAHPPKRKKKANSAKANSATEYPETLTVQGLSHEGRGIAKHDGKTIFISGALPYEVVRYQVDTRHRHYDEASVTEICTASPQRTEPACPHYGQCGGCDLQHLEHAHQLPNKEQLVLNQLERLGQFQPEIIDEGISSPTWHYRRSCRIGINQRQRDGSALVGFRRRGSSKLTAIDSCPVLAQPLNEILKQLPQTLETEPQFKEITHAELSLGENSGALTLRVKKRPSEGLCERLGQLADSQGFALYLDFGDRIEALSTADTLSYSLPEGTQIHFQPGDFIQVNDAVNQQMIVRALEWLELSAEDHVLDLFSGIGNFTLPLARKAGRVVGVEGVQEMVTRAAENARLNQLDNCEFYRADLSKDLRAMPWYKQGFNKILLDPPRTGAFEIIQQLESHAAEKILYVSCNPAMLARDGAELIRQGYQASRFCVMDMFPHTSHIESLLLFERTPR